MAQGAHKSRLSKPQQTRQGSICGSLQSVLCAPTSAIAEKSTVMRCMSLALAIELARSAPAGHKVTHERQAPPSRMRQKNLAVTMVSMAPQTFQSRLLDRSSAARVRPMN